MSRTVDLVVAGDGQAALAAAAEALERGRRVMVVLPSGDTRSGRRVRRALKIASVNANADHLTIVTSAEVVCVDGVDRVEAVVIRHARTGRVYAVNAAEFVRSNA